jgi:hypothetical protein
MRRFLLALRGYRAPKDDDADAYRPWWADDEEDPSLDFIRKEVRLRAHDDLMESIDKRPPKKLTIITTADVGGPKKAGQKQ